MFTRPHLIFSLTATALHVARINRASHEVLESADFEIESTGLAGAFEQARKQFGQRARLIVPEEYVYVTRLEIENFSSPSRSAIEKKIGDVFPEELGKMAWDYQVVASSKTGTVIELSGMTSDFTQLLKTALTQAHYQLGAVIPESYVLAHQILGKEVTLLIHERVDGWIIALLKDQLVITSLFQVAIPTATDIQNVIHFGKERKHLTTDQIVCSVTNTSPEELPQLGLPQIVLDTPLDPVLGAAKVILGKTDNQRLDLPLRERRASWWHRWF